MSVFLIIRHYRIHCHKSKNYLTITTEWGSISFFDTYTIKSGKTKKLKLFTYRKAKERASESVVSLHLLTQTNPTRPDCETLTLHSTLLHKSPNWRQRDYSWSKGLLNVNRVCRMEGGREVSRKDGETAEATPPLSATPELRTAQGRGPLLSGYTGVPLRALPYIFCSHLGLGKEESPGWSQTTNQRNSSQQEQTQVAAFIGTIRHTWCQVARYSLNLLSLSIWLLAPSPSPTVSSYQLSSMHLWSLSSPFPK